MTAIERKADVGTVTANAEESFYAINLYTWLVDQDAALGLAVRVAEIVESIPEIDELATTVSQEEDPTVEPVKAFIHFAKRSDGAS